VRHGCCASRRLSRQADTLSGRRRAGRRHGFCRASIAGKLAERFGQPVITDNRTGATGTSALEMVAKAPPDGYTFAVFNIGHLTSALLAKSLRIDPAGTSRPSARSRLAR